MIHLIVRRTLLCAALLPSAAAAQSRKPKVLLYYDMEGLSGISRETQTSFRNAKDYQPAREFLTGDVNAAIRGLIAGGAGEIVVTDAHGSGNPDPDIILEKMDKRATFEWKDTPFDPYRDSPNATYQAIVCIGMHARANTPGFLAHTYTIEPAFRVNGLDISETEIIAHFAAKFGIPVIMVSGDDVLQKQMAERLPAAEYGLVKRARSRGVAEVMPEAQAWKNIETASKQAIEKLRSFKAFPVAPVFKWEMGWQNADQADLVEEGSPGVRRVSPTAVAYESKTFAEGYNRAVGMISLAGNERTRLLFQILQKRPEGAAIMKEYRDAVLERWLDPGPVAAAAPKPKKTRHHGAT